MLRQEAKQQNPAPPLILAVEDNEDNLLLMSYTLESLGYRYICQQDSSATILVAEEHQPDLILLDILLPGFSGIDIVRCLKQQPLTKDIPVLAVTALASDEDRERILMAGFDGHLSKPYMLEDLEATIHQYLAGKHDDNFACNFC